MKRLVALQEQEKAGDSVLNIYKMKRVEFIKKRQVLDYFDSIDDIANFMADEEGEAKANFKLTFIVKKIPK